MKIFQIKKENLINIIVLFLILAVGTIFRMHCLSKPDGLWYDELVSYQEAIKPNTLSISAYTLKTDVHFPFYPILLHFWGIFFSFSDLALRGFSAFLGCLTILLGFFAGKSFKNLKTGLVLSAFLAINSFLIYYSQEVRLYSLLAFISMFFLFANIQILKKESNEHLLLFILASILLLSANILSFIFVYSQFLFYYLYLILYENKSDEDKIFIKKYIKSLVLITLLNLPNFIVLILKWDNLSSQINGYYFEPSSIFIIIQNWFTPILEGLNNNPQMYFSTLNFNFESIIFIFIPIVIMFYGIINGLKKDKRNYIFLLSALTFLFIELLAVKLTNFKILSRYTIVSFINILFITASGFGLNKTKLSKILCSLYIFISTFYLVYMPNAAFRMQRGGYRPLCKILNENNINKDDIIVVWNRKTVLNKYTNNKNMEVISLLKDFAYSSEIILENEDILSNLPIEQRKTCLRKYFASRYIPNNNKYLIAIIYKRLKTNQRFVITTKSKFDNYTQDSFIKLVNNNENFSKTSYNDLLTIKALIDVKTICDKQFKTSKKEYSKNFVVITYTK